MLKRYYDEIFGEKQPIDLNKPYHEYGKDEIIEFARREKTSCLEIMKKYSSNLDELAINVWNRSEREEYSSCKGVTLNRGIYHPGDGFEFVVTNIGRGHRLKKAPDDGSRYFCFSFDKDDNLLCAEKLAGKEIIQQEMIIRENDMEYGLVFQQGELNHIYAAGYKGKQLNYTYRYDKLSGSIADVCMNMMKAAGEARLS